MKRIKLLVTSVILGTSLLVSTSVYAKLNINVKRLAGQDRYETCNQVVTEGWKQSDTAIIVNSQMFADAITSAPLSKKYNAPILLADKYSLSNTLKQKLSDLNVKNVIIIGGTGVISDELKSDIEKMNITVNRISGQDRYETSVKVAETLGNNSENAFIVDGDSWEDALSVAPIASKLQAPILLVNKNYIPDSVLNFEKKNSHTNYMIGDFDFITNQNITSKLNGTVKTISGSDKLSINLNAINYFKDQLDLNKVFLASSNTFADALSGSALASIKNNPIILTGNNTGNIKGFIDSNQANIQNLYVLGGNSVITDGQIDLLKATEKDQMQDFKNSCKEYEYKVISKNPDSHRNENMRFRGKVMQILENGNNTFMLIQVTNGEYDIWRDNVAIFYNGKTDVYKDDIIDVWGTCTGNYSYTSVAGYNLSVPGIQAKYIEK